MVGCLWAPVEVPLDWSRPSQVFGYDPIALGTLDFDRRERLRATLVEQFSATRGASHIGLATRRMSATARVGESAPLTAWRSSSIAYVYLIGPEGRIARLPP